MDGTKATAEPRLNGVWRRESKRRVTAARWIAGWLCVLIVPAQVSLWAQEVGRASESGPAGAPVQTPGLSKTAPTALAAGVENDANQSSRPEASADGSRKKSFSTAQQTQAVRQALAIGQDTKLSPIAAGSGAIEISPDPIQVSGDSVHRWSIGDADATLLQGDCVIQQASRQMTADSILLVVDGDIGQVRNRIVIAGMRDRDGRRLPNPQAVTIRTLANPQIVSPQYRGQPKQPPDLLKFLPDSADIVVSSVDAIRQVQFQQPIVPSQDFAVPAGERLIEGAPITMSDGATTGGWQFFVGGGTRSVEILARGASMPPQIETVNRPELSESVVVARGGVTVLVRDVAAQLPSGEMLELGTVSLSADRIVGWFPLFTKIFDGTIDSSQIQGELYLEGDIVFRQGERIIYAESMYYNISTEQGIVLDAEAITTVPEYQGIVRLKADVIQQISRGNFRAFDAAITSSRMGVPRYWLQSEQLQLTDRERFGTDPVTGLPTVQRQSLVKSSNNFVYFGGVPLFYWPTISTSLEQPAYYLVGAKVKSDGIYGTQVRLDFDMFQLLGIENRPQGVQWEISTDYLSDRGFGLGTNVEYQTASLFGHGGPTRGFFDAWGIRDTGLDTLGLDRRDLKPEASLRGRVLLRHRQYLRDNLEFIAESGLISDRNFLEQYFENEWDRDLDHRTALRLRKYHNNHLIDLSAQAQVNDFFTEEERLPLLEHYLFGASVLHDSLTWTAHSKVGYQRLNVADTAKDPAEAAGMSPLPGEANRSGIVASTRQEIALPLNLGPLRIIPNLSGEAAHYGDAMDGDSLTRLTGQAGIRTSLQMWRVDPAIQSSLLNMRGLAHKIEWTSEYFYADSDASFDDLPSYDPLDDNAQEQFRRRFIQDTFGGALPGRFDPRTYALRHGLQQLIASPSDVIADDLQQVRLGLNQRWQTKRGLPGRERIVDLFQLDVDVLLFPDADRDNFGETLGPATYDARFNIGDRVTLLSDGYFDSFDQGLRSVSAGFRTSRPGLGDYYIGLLSLEGPISSTVLRSKIDYRMNEKWILSAGTTYDFGEVGNVGQTFGLTRIGESMLVRVGVNVDTGRDNSSFGFLIEPRFWPSSRRSRLGGQLIPPPGVEGLE